MADPKLEAWIAEMGNKHGWSKVDFDRGSEVKVSKEDMDAFDHYKGQVDTMVRVRLNELKITGLAESAAIQAAISQMTNQASFASEFEATPNYKKALADAFLGSWEEAAGKATSAALSALGLPDVAGPVFKFLDTLKKENARALAAAGEKTVKDFLNKSLDGVVKNLGKQLQGLGKDSVVVKACLEAAHYKATVFYEEDKAAKGKAQKRETKLVTFCDELQAALGKVTNIGTMDVSATHKAALAALVTGLTAKGYVDFGVVSLETERIEGGGEKFKLKGGVKFEDGTTPKLVGTPKNDRFANAINDYLKSAGATVNDLDIEKRAHFKLWFDGTGTFSFLNGHTMDGYAKWKTGTPSSVRIDGGDLLSVVKGDVPADYVKWTQIAFQNLVKDKLTAKTVKA